MEIPTEVASKVIDADDEREEEACLVGRLVTDQNWNPSRLIEAMKETWKPIHGVSAMEWEEKLILFRFISVIDRDWVLKNQPWQFEESLFAIQEFIDGNEQQSPSSVNVAVDQASFWARLYGVPISSTTESSLRFFVKHIGGILDSVDRWGEDSVGMYVRFKMFMDITKPLERGIAIRVKGEVVWLPLKYEDLPIYCFCCGTIGHCRKNCHSPQRNMKYGSELNAPRLEKRKSHLARNLSEKPKPTARPTEIIENILSRLPAKSLHRFKAVSKQWKDIISDPRFAEIHLQQSKKYSSSRNLLAWEVRELSGYFVGEIHNNEIEFVSAIKHKWDDEYMGGDILCYCDGLYLKVIRKEKKITYIYEEAEEIYNDEVAEEAYIDEEAYTDEEAEEAYIDEEVYTDEEGEEAYIDEEAEEETTYVMWNPCSRTYRKFQSSYPIDDNHLCGICYDPLMKDYKVVLGNMKHYAVFSFRNNEWSEMKEFPFGGNKLLHSNGVSFYGSFYWILNFGGVDGVVEFEIIYFDLRDECLKKFHRPDCIEKGDSYYLTCVRGHLCLLINFGVDSGMRITKIVEGNEGDSWMESEAEYPFPSCSGLRPTCCNENEIILEVEEPSLFYTSMREYIIYDVSTNAFRRIFRGRILKDLVPVPYVENLFLL